MVSKIQTTFKRISKNEDLKKVTVNFISLMLLQVMNLLLPVISVPFLIKSIGVDGYGRIAFVQSITFYFAAIVDYGFDLTATKTISENRGNKQVYNRVFSAIFYSKIFLTAICTTLALLLIGTVTKFHDNGILLLLYLGVLIGNILNPTWFFQGIEEMKLVTAVNVVSKLLFFVAILLFVRSKADIMLVPAFFSLGYVVAGIISISIALFRFRVHILPPNVSEVADQLRAGSRIFLSRIFVNIYSYINVMVLGLFATYQNVAYYDIASRVVNALTTLMNQLNIAIYPYLGRSEKSVAGLLQKSRMIIRILLILGGCCFVAINLLAPYLLPIFIREEASVGLRVLLMILSLGLFLNPLNGQYTNFLVLTGNQPYLLKSVFLASLFSIFSSVLLSYFLQSIGLGVSTILVQLFLISLMILKVKKLKNETHFA